ncbi:hypothetical protein [Mesorhizobium huakuii]|uniref:Transposase n=1 Tax=Mesorhizobium huakuii TaxID=28104 RepID=A0ABZ0VJQ1_9HYPH|nr:hypothetical protein [Mesorhizobium huakuii]WQB97478.1 hypothetical protein U0R22_001608 [Mesorhizobium huakuii]
MQTRNDGTHVILPAAAPIERRPDRARLPVTLLRQTDGKLRHGGLSAAFVQPKHPVAERGRLHGASEINARTRDRDAENRFVYYRRLEEERRWQKILSKYDRLRRQDKSAHIARRSGGCSCLIFWRVPHIAGHRRNVYEEAKVLYLFFFFHIAVPRHGR